jgi:hypothetical protein
MTNERILFILNRQTGMAPYSHEFVQGGIDAQVLSGFVSAMGSFMGEVTGTEETGWKTVYGSDSTFLVEGGEWALGVLAVLRETTEVRSKLRSVVREFEDSFAALRSADGIDGSGFNEFDHFVRRVFTNDRLSEKSVLLKGSDWREIEVVFASPREAFRMTRFLVFAKNGQSLGEAAWDQGIDLEEATELVSKAHWGNALYFNYVPVEETILSLSERSSSFLLRRDNPLGITPKTVQVIGALDGRTPLSFHMRDLGLGGDEEVLFELGDLINRGYVQKISLEKRLVLVNECVLRNLILKCSDAVGQETVSKYFLEVRNSGISEHPWIGRVWLLQNGFINCVLEETMSPVDLDDMYDGLEFLIEGIVEQLNKDTGDDYARSLLKSVRETCHDEWNPYLNDGVM